MAEIEKVSEADRMEQANLERIVADVERVTFSSPPGTRPFFDGFLLNAKARLSVLEKKIQDEEHKEEEQKQSEVAMASLAEKETALDADEKAEYNGFLKEDFFTKKDFHRLDVFYAHSWDRLSQGGKDEMSHRIWEGVRRDEYKITDLPKSVQEKEEKQAYQVLRNSTGQSATTSRVPEQDRVDYLRAYESGSRDEAAKVLDRQSFKANMFRDADSTPVQHAAQNVKTPAEGAAIVASVKPDSAEKSKGQSKPMNSLDVSSIDLSGIALGDNPAQGAVANLPKPQNVNGRG
jgi:hypothetical protein